MGRGKGKHAKGGQYAPVDYAMLKSPAWRSLGGAAVKVWFELHTRYNGGNNGSLRLSYQEASETLGIGKATVQRAFSELQEKGFLSLVEKGNWYHRQAHQWRLTTKPMNKANGRDPPTLDFKSWRPPPKNKTRF